MARCQCVSAQPSGHPSCCQIKYAVSRMLRCACLCDTDMSVSLKSNAKEEAYSTVGKGCNPKVSAIAFTRRPGGVGLRARSGSGGRIRTYDQSVNSRLLYR